MRIPTSAYLATRKDAKVSRAEYKKYMKDINYEDGDCVGCGGRATRTNNTLCQECWQDAEGENE